ncbi:hypothetical protein SK128_011600, partial [Halocaridina rubra]
PSYCNICEALIMASDGAFCDSCGVCSDSPDCIFSADKTIPCKPITTQAATHKHQWVKGNLPFNAQCEVCEEECGTEPELIDLRCCWCQRCAHDECVKNLAVATKTLNHLAPVGEIACEDKEKEKIETVCDLGKRSDCIVPPNCIILKSSSLRKQLVIKQVMRPKLSTWSPVIVVGE